jgi:HSP20 family protein
MATTAVSEKPKQEVQQRRAPLDWLEEMQEDFKSFWTNPFRLGRPLQQVFASSRFPRADMYEKNDLLIVKVDLPGMKKEDIQVALDDGDLVVRGESKTESEVKEEDYYRLERGAGQFYRRFTLPFDAKAEKVEADFRDGVLEVRIPRPAAAKKPEPQKVPIR